MITDRSAAVMAHGLGGSTDLPIPLTYVLIGAAWALTFTFAVVALAGGVRGSTPTSRAAPARWVTTLVDAPAPAGCGDRACRSRSEWRSPRCSTRRMRVTRCPAFSTCCCGSGWWPCRWPSDRCGGRSPPVRTVHRLLGRRSLGLRYPEWAGYWPAAVGLLAFVWLELASPDPGSLGAIKIWLLLYVASRWPARCASENAGPPR